MSIFTRVPNSVVSVDFPFLFEVDFAKYEEKLLAFNASIQEAADDVTRPVATAFNSGASLTGSTPQKDALDAMQLRASMTRLVNMQEPLDELQLILGSASTNSAWVHGPQGVGKTALIEAYLRGRARKRLSSHLLSKPDFLFDVSGFFKLPRDQWVPTFDKMLARVTERQGMLLIDHIDDFVELAGPEAGRMMNSLVSALESSDDIQAIILSEDDNDEDIMAASTGVLRRFKKMEVTEPSLDKMKPILLSQFRRLGQVHNVRYTEEAADEIIKLLTRYPGRAFKSARPENMVTFADQTGAFVNINKFAQPPEVEVLREKVGELEDQIAIRSRGRPGPEDMAICTQLYQRPE